MAAHRYTSVLTRQMIEQIYKENIDFEAEVADLKARIDELEGSSALPESAKLWEERDRLEEERDQLRNERNLLLASGSEKTKKFIALERQLEDLRDFSKKTMEKLCEERDAEIAAKMEVQAELDECKKKHAEALPSERLIFEISLKEVEDARRAALGQVKEADEQHTKEAEELRAKLKSFVDDYLASDDFAHRISREQEQAVVNFIEGEDFTREFDGVFTRTVEYVLGILNHNHPEWGAFEAFLSGRGKFHRGRRPPGA